MTVDPNEAAQGELPIEAPPTESPVAPPAPPPGVDVDVLADRVIEKLMSAAQTAAPEAQTQTYTPGPGGSVIQTLHQQASDPNHPLYATAVAQLEMMRRQGEEEEWAALGVAPGHAARSLYAQNPQAFSGRPRHAFTTWQLQESQRGNNERAREAAKAEQDKKAAEAVRDAAPGMPSRNVVQPTRSGRLEMTHEEFERRVINEPDLDEKADKGLIDWK